MNQKGLVHILISLIVVGVIAIAGAALWANYKNGHLFSQSQQDQTPQVQTPQIASCPKNVSGIFTYPMVKIDEIRNIPPLGHVNLGNKHAAPIQHVYFVFKNHDDTIQVRTQIFAPADSLLESISRADVLDESGKVVDSDFSVYFLPCKEIRVQFIHVRELSEALAKIYDAAQTNCYYEDRYKLRLCNVNPNTIINAGEPIGWGGGSQPALDVEVNDARVMNAFANPQRHTPFRLSAICPLDLYSGDLKTALYDKLADADGRRKRTTEPRCGSVAQDIPGTAQGEWFIGTAKEPDADFEGKMLALIHHNLEPIPGIIATTGTIVPYSGLLVFSPRHEGFVNREPSEIKDQNIYCFQNEQSEFTKHAGTGNGRRFTGRILIQLIDAKTLKAEYQEKSCDESFNFSSPTIYER